MTWTKLGDDFNDRDDLLGVSRSARLLYVEGYVYANRLGRDGRITRADLRRFTDAPDDDVQELIAAGLWEVDGENLLMDWSDQETADRVERRQQLANERQQRRRQHLAGDHTECLPANCSRAPQDAESVMSRVMSPVTSRVMSRHPDPPVPSDPSVPGRRPRDEKGEAGDAAGAGAPPHPDYGPDHLRIRNVPDPHQLGPDCCNLLASHPVHQATA